MQATNPAASATVGSGRAFFSDAVTALADIKTSHGQLYLLDLMNGAAATAYLQVFFAPKASVTLGTTVPDLVIKLPTNAGSGFRTTVTFPVPVGGINVSGAPGTGLCCAGTTTWNGTTTSTIGVTAIYA